MTVEELKIQSSSPQDPNIHNEEATHDNNDDIESLVRGLVEQAKAAEERSQALAERVALLEAGRQGDTYSDDGGNVNNLHDTAARASSNLGDTISQSLVSGTFGSTRISFADANDNNGQRHMEESSPPQDNMFTSSKNTSSLRIVKGVPESNTNPNYMNDDPEQISDRVTLLERRLQDYDDQKADVFDERKYALPESTFSLLVTHPPLSVPFVFAAFSVALSISCLSLTLASSISNGSRGNRLGVPAGVNGMVQAAQFLGAIVGVLMEDEIPQGLQLIANGAGHTLLLNGQKPVQKRVIVSSIFRLIVGYLFLSSLFIALAQSSDVIEIFYDVLALEFVENIDDTAYALAKRGFFGRSMLMATNQTYNLKIDTAGLRRSVIFGPSDRNLQPSRSLTERRLSFSGLIASNNRVNHLVRTIYFLNAAVVLAGLGYFASMQNTGTYRCNTISVLFDEEIWEDAHVRLPDGTTEDRLLIYSYFNGNYEEVDMYEGYPRYVEMNKNDGSPFGPDVVPAEIVYCHEIDSWVFRHPNIMTSPTGKDENECSWLWRSSSTEDFDILSTSDAAWEAWVGEVKPLAQVSITCNECSERPDCNYHGTCVDKVCQCEDTHFGDNCQFEKVCPSLATEKAHSYDPVDGIQWKQDKPIRQEVGLEVYNRPVYIQKGLSGEPFDMRLYKILEKEKSPSPSNLPSNIPSVTLVPTPFPSSPPTFSQEEELDEPPLEIPDVQSRGTSAPTPSVTPTLGYDTTFFPMESPPLHTQNEYDTAPDFADWDDFFESPTMHNLNDIMEDYSVVISFIGSRFYATMVDSDSNLYDLFPEDYHAFWSQAFDVNRTFIISDTTFASSPVGVDFYEMRRRIVNSMHDQNIQFSYGPFGALIPLMSYEGTGFFHCLRETEAPSTSPSSSGIPTSLPSTSMSPTSCYNVGITIKYNDNPRIFTWSLSKMNDYGVWEGVLFKDDYDQPVPNSVVTHTVCLVANTYEFYFRDDSGDWTFFTGFYSITVNGREIANRSEFDGGDFVSFGVGPPEPTSSPQPSVVPSSSTAPSSAPTTCFSLDINIRYDGNPDQTSWTLERIASFDGEYFEEGILIASSGPNSKDPNEQEIIYVKCLSKGFYNFTMFDSNGDGLENDGKSGYYTLRSDGKQIKYGGKFRFEESTTFSIPNGYVLPSKETSPPLASPLQATVLSQEEAPAISVAIANQSTSSSTENEDSVTVSESKDPVVEPIANPKEDTPAPVPFD